MSRATELPDERNLEGHYDQRAAALFFGIQTTDGHGRKIRMCGLCGAFADTTRLGFHLHSHHRLEIPSSPKESTSKFVRAAFACGGSVSEIARFITGVSPPGVGFNQVLRLATLSHINDQIRLGHDVLAQIETLVGLGCTPAQIAEQFTVPSPT